MISIDKQLISETLKKAHQSPRHRQIFRFHKLKEPVQRMLNAVLPNSYVRPHYHFNKPEVFIALRGKLAIIKFNKKGQALSHFIIDEKGPNFGIEINPKEWHSMIALKPSVVYEVKQGPYNKKTDKVFPDWAPEENTKEGSKYLKGLKSKINSTSN